MLGWDHVGRIPSRSQAGAVRLLTESMLYAWSVLSPPVTSKVSASPLAHAPCFIPLTQTTIEVPRDFSELSV